MARRRPLSASVGLAVGRLLLDVLPARRQLGLQVLREQSCCFFVFFIINEKLPNNFLGGQNVLVVCV